MKREVIINKKDLIPNTDYEFSNKFWILIVFHLLVGIWIFGTLRAKSRFITYYSTSSYYYSSKMNHEGEANVVKGIKLGYLKHFGSLCLGSSIYL